MKRRYRVSMVYVAKAISSIRKFLKWTNRGEVYGEYYNVLVNVTLRRVIEQHDEWETLIDIGFAQKLSNVIESLRGHLGREGQEESFSLTIRSSDRSVSYVWRFWCIESARRGCKITLEFRVGIVIGLVLQM